MDIAILFEQWTVAAILNGAGGTILAMEKQRQQGKLIIDWGVTADWEEKLEKAKILLLQRQLKKSLPQVDPFKVQIRPQRL